ncbi:OmpH family outer membrane protein [Urechidicola sp. KH5]
MRNLKTLLLVAVVAFGFNMVQAQSKVAHVDLGEIIKSMPETKAMNDDLEKLKKTYEDDLKAKGEELDAKVKKYDAEAPQQTQQENQKRVKEVQQEDLKIQQGLQFAERDIANKGNEMSKPIFEKARNAVDAVAKELGYDYVLDVNSLIVAQGKDITENVKAKLGITAQ